MATFREVIVLDITLLRTCTLYRTDEDIVLGLWGWAC